MVGPAVGLCSLARPTAVEGGAQNRNSSSGTTGVNCGAPGPRRSSSGPGQLISGCSWTGGYGRRTGTHAGGYGWFW